MADDLYERDFYLWTQAQAEALRARGGGGGQSNVIEWDRLAEEVEDLGKRELRSVESLLSRIIEHLHKVRCSQMYEPRRHWRKEIIAFRGQLEDLLTPSMRSRLQHDLERAHKRGALNAERWMMADDIGFDPLDLRKRWTLEELLGEQDDPLDGLIDAPRSEH